MLEADVIGEWTQEYNDDIHRIVLAPKKVPGPSNPHAPPIWQPHSRFCIDYSTGVNRNSLFDTHHAEAVDDLFERAGAAKVFTSMDVRSAHWCFEIDPESYHLTVFEGPDSKLYYCKRLPFGLSVAPDILQRTMQGLLDHLTVPIPDDGCPGGSRLVPCECLLYMDDVLVATASASKQGDTEITDKELEEHLLHLHKVITTLAEAGFLLHPAKIAVGYQEATFLGHVLRAGGQLSPMEEKVRAIREASRPVGRAGKADLTMVRSFLSTVSFYTRYIPGMSARASHLNAYLKKGALGISEAVRRQALRDIFDPAMAAYVFSYLPVSPTVPVVHGLATSMEMTDAPTLMERLRLAAEQDDDYFRIRDGILDGTRQQPSMAVHDGPIYLADRLYVPQGHELGQFTLTREELWIPAPHRVRCEAIGIPRVCGLLRSH